MRDPILRRSMSEDLITNAATNALQADIVDLLRSTGIRIKNIPRLRRHITDALSLWSRKAEDLPEIRLTLLDRVKEDTGIWERLT